VSDYGISDETAEPRFRTLSVIVPVFNERSTVAEIVRRMRSVELPIEREIVVVDDGSDDGTGAVERSARRAPAPSRAPDRPAAGRADDSVRCDPARRA